MKELLNMTTKFMTNLKVSAHIEEGTVIIF
jgi:hypothetical protein